MNELKYYLPGPKKGQPVMQKDIDVFSATIASMEYAGIGIADIDFSNECDHMIEQIHMTTSTIVVLAYNSTVMIFATWRNQ